MPRLKFFVPTNRFGKNGRPKPLDGTNELVAAERAGYGPSLKRRNGKNAEESCLCAMREVGWETPERRCRVTLTFVEPHDRRDPDNVYGGAKFILDGITERKNGRTYGAGAIRDDSQRCIELCYGPILIDMEHVGCWVLIETIGD